MRIVVCDLVWEGLEPQVARGRVWANILKEKIKVML